LGFGGLLREYRGGMLVVQSNTRFQVRPLYLQVRDALLERIKDGRWKPGANLPSEIDLYRQLGVSLGTLRKALSVLETEQLIIREPGRGTFVRDHQAGSALGRFNPIRGADGAPLRGQVRSRKVDLALPTPAERNALRLKAGDQVVRISRVRVLNERPFAYEQSSLSERRFPGLAGEAAFPDELEELARDRGVILARAEAKVRLAPASAAAAQALSLAERTPVLSVERVAFDTDHEPIETLTAYYDLRDEYCRLDLR
jgi:GntR family transcriptional regulator